MSDSKWTKWSAIAEICSSIAILLTLFYLGIKNIRLGPSLPAFVTPAVLNVLVEKFAIKPITTVESDLKAALAGA